MIYGGLRPIPSRLALDCLTVASLFYCAATAASDAFNHVVLLMSFIVTIATAGLTARWTISFPMLPFLVLQSLRRIEWVSSWSWAGVIIGTLSIILAIVSGALCYLFPAVNLSPIRGKYNVGIMDVHIPVDFTEGRRRGSLLGTESMDSENEPSSAYVTARLLYPTNEQPENISYLDPETAPLICAELMKAGAPPPLKKYAWMLGTWRFTTIAAKRNARPASSDSNNEKFPMAIYSHGLTGSAVVYSYQAMSLAANGMVVLSIDHTDKSAVAVRRRDSSHLLYDSSLIAELMKNKKNDEYEEKRRAQTDHRVEEILSALRVFKSLNHCNIPDLDSVGVSFIDKLDVSDVTLMGHSFGGCSVLAAAAQKPHLITTVVAHDPAVAWMPDSARTSLFTPEYSNSNKKKEEEKKDGDGQKSSYDELESGSIHDVNMLFLYCDEWAKVNWGSYKRIKGMFERNEIARDGASDFGVIKEAKHQEFSDTCMLTPLWLARATGLTGVRNPNETAEEIAARTVEFLEAIRKKRCKR